MADLSDFGRNIFFLLGILIALAFLGILLTIAWVALRCYLWRGSQKRARQAMHQNSHRADGGRYPPVMGGVCDQCGRISQTIYHPQAGPRLCSTCYEQHWRAERGAEPTTSSSNTPVRRPGS